MISKYKELGIALERIEIKEFVGGKLVIEEGFSGASCKVAYAGNKNNNYSAGTCSSSSVAVGNLTMNICSCIVSSGNCY